MLKLITLLVSGIPAVVAALIAFIARKAGTASATIAAFVLMTAAFIGCINIILNSILSILTIPAWISVGLGMFMPTNFTVVLAGIVSSNICRAAYELATMKIQLANSAN